MEEEDETMDAALRYAHDVGFDEGYEVGWEEGYQEGVTQAGDDEDG